jgi:DNA-binding LacI/PurR family transcriptional regulator
MVTLQDIADKTGFSRAVVSRALNPYPDQKVAERTCEIIRRAAAEMGYKRNQAASLLARGASPAIGIFLPGHPSELLSALIQGISKVANHYGFACNIYSGITESDYREFLQTVQNTRNAGVITYLPFNFSGDDLPRQLAEVLPEDCKVIVANSPVDFKRKNVESVMIDNFYGGEIAARHLLERGCKTFFYEGSTGSWQRAERNKGFFSVLEKAGISRDSRFCIERSRGDAAWWRSVVESIAQASAPVGVFCNDDDTALMLLRYLSAAGVAGEVPEKIKIVGFNDISLADWNGLTTIRQPFAELGEAAMTLLVNHLTRADIKVPTTRLQPELIVRQTT